MQNHKRYAFLLILFTSFFLWGSMVKAATFQSDPVSLLRHIADNMIAGLQSHQATLKTKPQIVYNLAYQYVVPYADLTEMSKRVLPPAVWNRASAKEREQFQHEFTRTVIRTYASALTSYKDQTIQFYPVRGGTHGLSTVEVNSQISGSSGDPIRVLYRLVNRNNQWRLYDMSVEGVDMIESFRAQFADILAQGNMSVLLQRLARHNA